FQRGLSLSQHPRPSEADLRRLRAGANVLGHRHHPHAVLVAAVRDHVHRRAALADGARPGSGHGPGRLQLARMEDPRAMKQAILERYGKPEDGVRCADTPDVGAPAAGEVVFDVLAFPINPADISMCRGGYRLRPTVRATPGAGGA